MRRITLLVIATSETCAGHGDDERKIQKVPIVRRLRAGKFQAADLVVAALAIIFVRIMQCKDRVHEQPRQHDRDHADGQVCRHAWPDGVFGHLGDDGDQAGDRRGAGQEEQREGALRPGSRRGGEFLSPSSCATSQIDENEIKPDAGVPAGQQPGWRSPIRRHQRHSDDDANGDRDQQPRMQAGEPRDHPRLARLCGPSSRFAARR